MDKFTTGDVFPSQKVLTLGANKKKQIVPGVTKWEVTGFKKGQLFINARSESVEEKRTFSKAFRESRCAFPMSGFYEWDSEKQKFLCTNDEKPIYVAGFYRMHENIAESIILTTQPNATIASIHDRMPLIIDKSEIDKWIIDLAFARAYLHRDMSKYEPMTIVKSA